MPRIRSIKQDLYLDEEIAKCTIPARYLFPGLWTLADREGRLEDRPQKIKAQLYPYDEINVDALLDELQKARAIIRYSVKGYKFLQIRTFSHHQAIHKKETPSYIPPPTKTKNSKKPGNTPVEPGNSGRVRSNGLTVSLINGKETPTEFLAPNPKTDSPPSDPSSPSPLFYEVTIPLTGGEEFQIPLKVIEEFRHLYPGVDVDQELRAIRAWNLTNTEHRKTARGVMRHINRWLANSQNKSGPARASPRRGKPSTLEHYSQILSEME